MTLEQKRVEKEPKERPLFIAVMGVTGAGKTTFARFLSERIGGRLLEELPVGDNPLFERYYENPVEYALPTQLLLVWEKWLQTKGSRRLGVKGVGRSRRRSVVQEPPIYEDALYAEARFGNEPAKWEYYHDFYGGLISADNFPTPDLIAYLHISFPQMLENIRQRAKENPERTAKLKESEEYWQRLWRLHEDWVKQNPLGLKIITLEMDNFHFSRYNNRAEALEAAYQELKRQSGGLIK